MNSLELRTIRRLVLGKTLTEVAEELWTTPATISRYERGINPIPNSFAQKFKRHFSIDNEALAYVRYVISGTNWIAQRTRMKID